jgi:repressor LexA
MNYFQLLKKRIEESGLTLEKIAEELEKHGFKVGKGYISRLQNGKVPNPATNELTRAIAKVINADAEELLLAAVIEKAPEELHNQLAKLIKAQQLRNEMESTLRVKQAQTGQSPEGRILQIPLLGSIAAGTPIDRIELAEDIEYIDKSIVRNNEAFALRVKGDSMIGDHITEGDVVICISTKEVHSSDIAVVAVDGDLATLKRVKCQEGICMLIPSNPRLEPTLVPANKVEILGKVVEIRRRLH